MKFYVIRHPVTEYNLAKITQGHADSPLTPQGITVAKELGKTLANFDIQTIFCSDLGRCMQTARIVNEWIGVDIVPVRSLREQDLGKYNGMKKEDIKKEFDEHDYTAKPEGGESFIDMKKRVLNWVFGIHLDNVLLVTHTGCFQSILADAINSHLDDSECYPESIEIGIFELKNKEIHLIERRRCYSNSIL